MFIFIYFVKKGEESCRTTSGEYPSIANNNINGNLALFLGRARTSLNERYRFASARMEYSYLVAIQFLQIRFESAGGEFSALFHKHKQLIDIDGEPNAESGLLKFGNVILRSF